MTTIPDPVLESVGITLTTAPNEQSSISQSQAVAAADSFAKATEVTNIDNEALFGEMHNDVGSPAEGQLVWVVNVNQDETPPNGWYAFVVVNATTGIAIGEYTIPPASDSENNVG